MLLSEVLRNRKNSTTSSHRLRLADAERESGLPDQIFLGTTYQNGGKYTKWPQNMPNGRKIFRIAIVSHSKALQNMLKLGFLVWNYTILHPWTKNEVIFGVRKQILKLYQHFSFQGPPKYTQAGILGTKIYEPSGNLGEN
jgi:hypothetical protein